MQHAAFQGQVQQKRSPVIVGIGAAAVASAITLMMMLGNPSPAAVPDQTVSSSSMKQCQMIQRRLLVSTTKGSGTVRFRASGYLSPPVMLTTQPQVVIFPLMIHAWRLSRPNGLLLIVLYIAYGAFLAQRMGYLPALPHLG